MMASIDLRAAVIRSSAASAVRVTAASSEAVIASGMDGLPLGLLPECRSASSPFPRHYHTLQSKLYMPARRAIKNFSMLAWQWGKDYGRTPACVLERAEPGRHSCAPAHMTSIGLTPAPMGSQVLGSVGNTAVVSSWTI